MATTSPIFSQMICISQRILTKEEFWWQQRKEETWFCSMWLLVFPSRGYKIADNTMSSNYNHSSLLREDIQFLRSPVYIRGISVCFKSVFTGLFFSCHVCLCNKDSSSCNSWKSIVKSMNFWQCGDISGICHLNPTLKLIYHNFFIHLCYS